MFLSVTFLSGSRLPIAFKIMMHLVLPSDGLGANLEL